MPLQMFITNMFLQVSRRKLVAVVIFLGMVGAAVAYLVLTPQFFTARTTLLAKFGREFSFRGNEGSGFVVPPSLGPDDIVGSVMQIMGSRKLVERVVSEVGVEALYPKLIAKPPQKITPQQAAILAFTKALSISQVKRSNVIEVTFTHTNPQVAARALNLFVDAFQAEFLALYQDNSREFLEASANTLRKEYDLAQKALAEFQAANHVSPTDAQSVALMQRKAETELELARLLQCCAESDGVALLRSRLDQMGVQLTTLQIHQSGLLERTRRRDQAQRRLDDAELQLQQAQNSHAMDVNGISSISVIDRADVPAQARKPSRTIRLLLVVLLASVTGPAMAFLIETFRRRFSTAGELQSCFEVPVLAEIPNLNLSGSRL